MLVFLPKVKEIMHDVMTYASTYDFVSAKGLVGIKDLFLYFEVRKLYGALYIFSCTIFLIHIFLIACLVLTCVNTFSPTF